MMQPYAWLFTHGYLKIDDRTRGTTVRGLVAIHASKRFHSEYYDFIRTHTDWPMPEKKDLEFGGIVGQAHLVSLLAPVDNATFDKRRESQGLDFSRAHFGAPGFHGFVFENPEACDFVPIKGRLGFFLVPEH